MSLTEREVSGPFRHSLLASSYVQRAYKQQAYLKNFTL